MILEQDQENDKVIHQNNKKNISNVFLILLIEHLDFVQSICISQAGTLLPELQPSLETEIAAVHGLSPSFVQKPLWDHPDFALVWWNGVLSQIARGEKRGKPEGVACGAVRKEPANELQETQKIKQQKNLDWPQGLVWERITDEWRKTGGAAGKG